MAIHSRTLPGKSHGQRSLVGCSPWGREELDMFERLHFHFSPFMHWRRKWQPTPVFLPGESQGRGSLVGCRLWGRTESDTTEVTQQQQQLGKEGNAQSNSYLAIWENVCWRIPTQLYIALKRFKVNLTGDRLTFSTPTPLRKIPKHQEYRHRADSHQGRRYAWQMWRRFNSESTL